MTDRSALPLDEDLVALAARELPAYAATSCCVHCGAGVFTRDGQFWFHELRLSPRACALPSRRRWGRKQLFVATPGHHDQKEQG